MRLAVALVPVLLLAGALAAGNARGEFRGDERYARAWSYNSEYFFQSESFHFPFWWDDIWTWGASGYRVSLGSVKTDEFYLVQEGKVVYPVFPWLKAVYRFEQGEDYDVRYAVHTAEVRVLPGDHWRVTAFTELEADKKWIDVGGALAFRLPGLYEAEVRLNLVDAVYNVKAGKSQYARQPYALSVTQELVLRQGLTASLGFAADLPLVLEDWDNQFVFRFHRYRAQAKAAWDFLPYWTLYFEGAVEMAGKRWEYEPYVGSGDPREQAFAREAMEAKVEVLWRLGLTTGHHVNAGIKWKQLRETSEFPYDRIRDARLKKRDIFLWVRVRIDLGEGFFLLPAFYVGPVWHHDHYVNEPWRDNERFQSLNSKLNLTVGYRFGPNCSVIATASAATDTAEFDGGHCSFVLSF